MTSLVSFEDVDKRANTPIGDPFAFARVYYVSTDKLVGRVNNHHSFHFSFSSIYVGLGQ